MFQMDSWEWILVQKHVFYSMMKFKKPIQFSGMVLLVSLKKKNIKLVQFLFVKLLQKMIIVSLLSVEAILLQQQNNSDIKILSPMFPQVAVLP